jgi:hypothetical protein
MYEHQVIHNGVLVAKVYLDHEPSIQEMVEINKKYFPDPKPINQIIGEKLDQYQAATNKILRDLKIANTMAGITVSQSRQMFKDYADVLLMLREGAYPSAIAEIQEIGPVGFVTQEILDQWVAVIQKEL